MTSSISARARADALARLRAAGCVFAEDELAVLSAAAADEDELATLVGRRTKGEPLEQVVGYADFCGVRIRLRPGVFVPRVRSGLLARIAISSAERKTAPIVVDLCCGSGALAAVVATRVRVGALHAADVDAAAVACAGDNLAAWGGHVHHGDLFAALPTSLLGRIDVLLANVPYVPTEHIRLLPAEARLHEPRTALDGGLDGLDLLRAVAKTAPSWLAPGGVMLSEVMAAQAEAATVVMHESSLRPEIVTDDDLEATVVLGHRDRTNDSPEQTDGLR
jgi:release factor glutamine methyltransferase